MPKPAPARTIPYLSFRLGKDAYALDLGHAREITDVPPLRRIPKAPEWIPGLMNLRGRVVPVVDLKKKFDLPSDSSEELPYVVVVELAEGAGERVTLGLLADAVLDVFELGPGELDPPPKLGARSRGYLLGTTQRDGAIVAVLDASKVLEDSDVPLPSQDEDIGGEDSQAEGDPS